MSSKKDKNFENFKNAKRNDHEDGYAYFKYLSEGKKGRPFEVTAIEDLKENSVSTEMKKLY